MNDDFYSVNLSSCCNSPVLTSPGLSASVWTCVVCRKPCCARNVVRYTASTTLDRPRPRSPNLRAFLLTAMALIGVLIAVIIL